MYRITNGHSTPIEHPSTPIYMTIAHGGLLKALPTSYVGFSLIGERFSKSLEFFYVLEWSENSREA